MTSYELGIIGVGAMGSSLLKGILRNGVLHPSSIITYDIDLERNRAISDELGCSAACTLKQMAEKSRRLLLAVKPEKVGEVLLEFAGALEGSLIVSIAAGVSIGRIRTFIPSSCSVIRAMPNTPAMVGEGMIALSFGNDVTDSDRDWARRIFACVGSVVEVREEQIDAVTAISGSGPAYVYLFLESLIDAGVTAGLPHSISQQLAVQTVLGAARMMQTGKHPAQLRAEVTSPGGTTAAGLRVLEREGVRSALIEAVLAAKTRSQQLTDGS